MATVTKGKTFISGETVEPADMHQLVDSATVTNIVDADIGSGAAIAASKLAATLDLSSKTITLPDSNIGTSKIANAAVTAAKLDGAQTGSAPIYGCRAWVNFNGGAGTTVDGEFRCTIRGSGNVSKVVRTSNPGQFVITFTTAMPSANYAAVASASHAALASRGVSTETYDTTTTNFVLIAGYASPTTNGTFYNPEFVHVAVFA